MKTNTISPDLQDLDFEQQLAWLSTQLKAMNRQLIVIGDFGEDLDDEVTTLLIDGERRRRELLFLNTMGSRRQNLFELRAVVANLAPPAERARLAKGTLKALNQPTVPVGVGTDCGNAVGEKGKKLTGISYMATADEVEPGEPLLVRALTEAEDGSITLVLISGLTDIASVLRNHSDLVKQKVHSVAIMGGINVVKGTDDVLLDEQGFMTPDDAANNKFDMESAKYTYRRFQELGIPLVILTRFASGACQVPRSFYDDLAATGHPVGIKLRNSQKLSIQALWYRANLPADDEKREKLPARCDKTWFCNTFCAGKGLDRTGDDEIWDLIVGFNLYDPMTLVAAIPDLRRKFFEPVTVTVQGVEHLVIGVSKDKHGVKEVQALREYMVQRCIESLTQSYKEKFAAYIDQSDSIERDAPPTPPPNAVAGAGGGQPVG